MEHTLEKYDELGGVSSSGDLDKDYQFNVLEMHVDLYLEESEDDKKNIKIPYIVTLDEAVNREVKATRDSIGILDASTLGKIDIKGRDVSEFLNRVYTNAWSKLEIGKCRYGVMLGDDGIFKIMKVLAGNPAVLLFIMILAPCRIEYKE